MPMRWPRQQVVKVLSARTPRSSGAPTRRRAWAGGGELRNGKGDGPSGSGPLPSIGSPIALTTRPSQPADGRTAAATDGHHRAAAAPHPFERRERHQQRIGAGKADHLAGDQPAGGLDRDPGAHRHGMQRARHLDHQAAHADHPAIDLDRVELVDLLGQRLHGRKPINIATKPSPLTPCLPASLIIASPSLGSMVSPARTEGRVARIGYHRFLKLNMNADMSKKLGSSNILGRFGRLCPVDACMRESCFVNHRSVSVRISSQGVFQCCPGSWPT